MGRSMTFIEIPFKVCILMCMRTNIVINDELMRLAKKLSGITTKRELVEEALKTFISVKKKKPLTDLVGKIQFREGYDHKSLRR